MPTPRFTGGSPLSEPENPHNGGARLAPEDTLPSLDIEAREHEAMTDLDAWGSAPVTDDAATQRPANPPNE